MTVALVAAADEQNVIGTDNRLPWHLPDDLAHFKTLTKGHPVIMGRKTFESIGRPLPKRRNIVVTRNRSYRAEGCDVVHSLDDALALGGSLDGTVFVIGGADIYAQALPHAAQVFLTRVHASVGNGDAFFPALPSEEWDLVSEELHESDDRHAHAFSFLRYERKKL